MKKSIAGMLFCAAAVMLCIACSTVTGLQEAESGGTQEEQILLYVEMETNSDWCDLQMCRGLEIARGIITAYSEYSSVFMEKSMINIGQPIADAESGKLVSVEAFVEVIPGGDEFQLEIKKGALGTTQVRVYRLDSPVAELLADFTCSGESGASEEHPALYSISLASSGKPPEKADLPYPAAELENMLANWQEGVTWFTFPAYSLYWPDSRQVKANSEGWYHSADAVASLKEEMENGPNPSLDYSLLEFSEVFHIPCSGENEARLLTISMYDGEPAGSDLFRFEKRDNVWKISNQFWSLGFNIP